MPKKKNFLGGMQNYDPKTGEYEPALEGANGEKPSSFKSFNKPKSELEKANDKRLGKAKEAYEKGKISKGQLDDIAIKGSEEDKARIKSKEEKYLKNFPEDVDKLMELKEKFVGKDYETALDRLSQGEAFGDVLSGVVQYEQKEESPKKYFKHPQVDGVWHDTGKTMEKYGNTYKVYENEEGHTWGVSEKMSSQFEEVEEPKHAFKLDKEKYPDVEETDYGFVYNVNGQSITDLKAQEKAFGGKIDENKDYGFTLTVDGDEVHYKSFDEAYAAAKKGSKPKDEEGVGKIIKYQPYVRGTTGDWNYGEDTRAKKLNNGLAMETKKQKNNHVYRGTEGVYKLVDIESGTTVGWAKDYEDALKKSKDRDFIGAVERARKVYWNKYPERKRNK